MGAGNCGRCRVRYLEGMPSPKMEERRFFSPEELRSGMRLACLHRVSVPCRVSVEFVQAPRIQILTKMRILTDGEPTAREEMSSAEREKAEACQRAAKVGEAAKTEQSPNMGRSMKAERCFPEKVGTAYRIAVDLGTTTIAMQARDVEDGSVLAEWKRMNPQRRYGSDVVSRIQAAGAGKAGMLKACVHETLAEGLRYLSGTCGKKLRTEIFLAGNTVMEHLLAGLPVDELGRYPFSPVTLQEQKVQIGDIQGMESDRYDLTILPGISAFVGADVLAGILAVGMHRRQEICLLIDLGTNGELVLGNRDRLFCTATAAGPAFEGRAGTEGTDMIAVIGELLEAGIVDETGLLAEHWFSAGIDWEQRDLPGRCVHISQEDIRAIQMAKAAIFSGICTLMRVCGIRAEQIERVWLAGGFGYFLNVQKAVQIGLLPFSLAERTRAVGNTSLAGAFLYGTRGGREEAACIRKICTSVNLAEQDDFSEMYLSHLNLQRED